MSSAKIICKLYKLKEMTSLSNVKSKILNRSETEKVILTRKDKKNGIVLHGDDAKFNYTWDKFSDVETLETATVKEEENNQEKKLQFIKAIANIEYSKQKKRDSNGAYLPKQQRTNEVQVDVYFIDIDDNIYAVICSSQIVYVNRVKKLIGRENFSSNNPNYSFKNDFFNWLFYQFDESNGVLGDQFFLKGIGGFMGNITDEQNTFKGVSQQTSELIITKAFISNGETLKNITARIKKDNEIDIVFGIDDKCNTVIYVNQSRKLLILDSVETSSFLLVYLYGYLIPKLRLLYVSEEESFANEDKGNFSKKIGLQVIRSIINNNNIDLSELRGFYELEENFENEKQIQ
ncbi:hypothetical protein [Enterococcus sp. DIV0756]|uniref:hypothetical protein n=1 Tax=Enterococcus sp. DIV0756 TaxID=2774636 RepID=UPI003F243C1F